MVLATVCYMAMGQNRMGTFLGMITLQKSSILKAKMGCSPGYRVLTHSHIYGFSKGFYVFGVFFFVFKAASLLVVFFFHVC